MAVKKVIYKEPSSYFNADMLKAAKEFDRKEKEAKKKAAAANKKKK